MQRHTQHEVISRLIACMNSEKPEAGRTTVLGTDRYLQPSQLKLEREHMFQRRPVIAGHVSQIAAVGDVLPVEVGGVSLVLARDGSGVQVFVNACSHRGAALLSKPACGKKALTCPYHSWSYHLDGSLLHVPQEETFADLNRESLALRRVAHEERHGFIWVQLEGGEPNVASFLGEAIDDDFVSFDLAEHVVAGERSRVVHANWKLVMDAFAEGYHLKSLHRDSLARFFVDAAIVDDFSPHVRQVGGRKTLADAVNAPDTWDVREHTTVFYNVFPNAILVVHPTWVSLLTLWPVEVNRVRVEHFMLSPAAADKDLDKSFRHIDEGVFEKEDLMIAANIQRSLEGGARSEMLLGLAEEGMRLFHAARDQAIEAT